jgi:hypothetical protein
MSKLVRINEITPEELNILQDIDRNCMAMHLPCPPKTFINMKVHEKGELTLDYDFRSKSWVRNAHNVLMGTYTNFKDVGSTYAAGSTYSKDTAGSARASNIIFNVNPVAPIGNSTYGIVVGTGTTAESFESYTLATPVVHGNSSGRLSYAAQNATVMSYDTPSKTWTIQFVRLFNNNSGGTITVTETAMLYDYSSVINFMYCRDLLDSPVEVANTAQLTVTYTMQYTFPA